MEKVVLQKSRGIPLYARISTYMRSRLEKGEWQVGDRLPSIEALADSFDVAPLTIRQALVELEKDGLIERRQGFGTVVLADARELRWLSLPTDWHSLVKMVGGLSVRSVLVEKSGRRPDDIPDGAALFDDYHFLKRIHSRNGEPFCEVDMYIATWIFERDPKRFRNRIAIPIIAAMHDIEIGKVSQDVHVDVASKETSDFLDIPLGSAVARVRRTICDSDGGVLFHSGLIYRGDVIFLHMDISPK